MRIEITECDIDNGTPCSKRDCPISLAFKRETHCLDVKTSYGIVEANGIYYQPIERKAFQNFIDNFDRSEVAPEVKPSPTTFTFKKMT